MESDQSIGASGGLPYAAAGSSTTIGSLGFVQRGTDTHSGVQTRAWPVREILAVAVPAIDFCLLLVAAACVFTVYFSLVNPSETEPGPYVFPALFAATLFVGGFERLGGYQLKQLSKLHWQLTRAMTTWSVTVSVLLLAAFLGKVSQSYSRGWAVAWITAAPTLLLVGRGILHLAINGWIRNGYLARNIVIIGAGKDGQRLIKKLQALQDKSIALRGVFDDRRLGLPPSVFGVKVLGTTDDLSHFLHRTQIDEVVVALPLDAERRLKALFDKLKLIAIDLRLSAEPVAERFQVRGMSYVGDVPMLEIADRPIKHWCAVIKWIEDQVLATVLLILASPLMAIAALLIKLSSPGPVFFVQERFGFNNGVIRVFKFRTMYVDRGDQSGARRTVQNDPRVTRIGRILRLLSIDELPQLVNVLRGDMSLVGPRPHAIAMKAGDLLYGDAVEQYLYRHHVKPGITGWAQVNGLRGEVDTVEKARARVRHDLYYIDHWSPWLDLKILLKTVGILALRDKAY